MTMINLTNGYYISSRTIDVFGAMSLIKESNAKIKNCKGILNDIREQNDVDSEAFLKAIEYYNNQIKSYEADIRILEKHIRKINNYKNIKIEIDGDYESKTTKIIFPKGTKNSFIKNWLEYNGLPIKTQHYKIDWFYDCTGEVHAEYVDIKNGIAEITQHYDV